MNLPKIVLSIVVFIACAGTAPAQETAIDLRTDGRIITDSRKDYFLRQVKTLRIQLSDSLRNKFGNTRVSAIVIPSNKIGDRYLIGVVIGEATLPDDWQVNEQDFRTIRDYSVYKALSAVESKYREIRLSVSLGIDANVATVTAELRLVIGESGKENAAAASYAGYLLQELDNSPQMSKFSDLVIKYRAQEGHALDQLLRRYIGPAFFSNEWNSLGRPFQVTESDEILKLRDLTTSQQVERQAGPSGEPGYLKLWYGRTVVVIPEKPGAPFSSERYKGGIGEYLRRNGSPFDVAAPVPAKMIPR